MKECFIIASPASCGNRIIGAILRSAGCHGYATTDDRKWFPSHEEKVFLIRHWLSHDLFVEVERLGYKITILMMVRDNHCAEASRQSKDYGDNLAAVPEEVYRHNFKAMPDDMPYQMVSYESLVANGGDKLLESLGLGESDGNIFIDNHQCDRIFDANAKYYGKVKPEDNAFYGDNLIWLPEKGIGYFPVKDQPYDDDYFDKYVGYAKTECGKAITEARVKFVNGHTLGGVMDVGIGCGAFIERRGSTCGFDINPQAIKWLQEKNLLADPRTAPYPSATFWDSLEHINNPGQILQYITDYVFVSMPIYQDAEHILRSKHFRKDEHCLYFTEDGFVNWMAEKGFDLLEIDDFETRLGREDILSFAFKRKPEEEQ